MVGIQAIVQLDLLLFGQLESFGHAGDAVPDILNQLNALGDAQVQDVFRG